MLLTGKAGNMPAGILELHPSVQDQVIREYEGTHGFVFPL